MAALVQLSLNPRYSPLISFPEEERAFLSKWLRWSGWEPEHFESDEVPGRAFLESDHKTVPDFVPIHAGMGMAPEARALVEEFEPGVHQFFPVEIVRRRGRRPIHRLDGRVLDTPYHALNVRMFLDAVWVERSEVRVSPLPGHPPMVSRRPGNYNVVLRREVVAGHHVWRGRYQLGGNHLFFSDALARAVEVRRLRKLEFIHLEEA